MRRSTHGRCDDPFALLGSTTLGLEGIFVGMAASEVLTGLLARQWTQPLRGVGVLRPLEAK